MAKSSLSAGRSSGNEEVQTIAVLSSSITHELRNYLTTILLCAELSEHKLGDIKKQVRDADCLLTSLQLQIKGVVASKPDTNDFKRYSIAKNVEEALDQYPFKPDERELITLNLNNDFEYIGDSVLTNHILYNLIRNALRAISNVNKGTITIKLESDAKFNKLIFRDTASGVTKEFLPRMFKLYESQSTAQGGSGIGLAFCKTIMQSYGGEIACDSVEGKYTEFTLSFPRV